MTESNENLPAPPRPPSAIPGPLSLEQIQDRLDALTARVESAESLNQLVPADKMRRGWGYAFYGAGGLLPLWSIYHLTHLAECILWYSQKLKAPPPGTFLGSVALWIFYAAPLVASLITAGAFFAIGGRLQMSTTAVERMEHLKAGADGSKKGSTTLQIDLPKAFKLGGPDGD